MFTYNNTDLILAPIAGYSDAGMRALCFRYGAGLCFTEMVSAKGLYYNDENTLDILTLTKSDVNTGVQIFGSDPDIMGEIVRYECMRPFPIIDINMGCPVPKIVRNGDGSALMQNPDLAYRVVKAVVNNADGRKVSAKIRKGYSNDCVNAVEVAQACQEGGADMVTVHGRTRPQMYSGVCDYEIIRQVKDKLTIPVAGNGDVTNLESYLKMKEFTGVDYVTVARGAIGKPYVFADILGKEYVYNIKEAILTHIKEISFLPDKILVNTMKKHIACYVKGMRGQKQIKESIFRAITVEEMLAIIDLIN